MEALEESEDAIYDRPAPVTQPVQAPHDDPVSTEPAALAPVGGVLLETSKASEHGELHDEEAGSYGLVGLVLMMRKGKRQMQRLSMALLRRPCLRPPNWAISSCRCCL
jgi:hypothetical protein